MIELDQVTVQAGAFELRNVSLQVPARAYAVLMGRTGSGKTTLLESICGLIRPRLGRICLAGREVTHLKPAERGIGYVPQDRALFASLSVREHLAFALKIRHWSPDQIHRRAGELADLLGLAPLLDRSVRDLSGGEAQRVALGRALSFSPKILCLDEPLSALDDDTRTEMHEVLRTVHQSTGVTVLHVTHNLADAQELADQLFRIDGGRIETSTPPSTGLASDPQPPQPNL